MSDFTDKEILQFAKAKLTFKKIDGEMCLDEVNAGVISVWGNVGSVGGDVGTVRGKVSVIIGSVNTIRGMY